MGDSNERLINADILAGNKAWSAKTLIDTGAQILTVSKEMIDKIKRQSNEADLNGRCADKLITIKVKAFQIKKQRVKK